MGDLLAANAAELDLRGISRSREIGSRSWNCFGERDLTVIELTTKRPDSTPLHVRNDGTKRERAQANCAHLLVNFFVACLKNVWVQIAVLLVLAAVIYGYRLGAGGLVNTEGHRTIPAWEMLRTGDFLTQRLFGAIYLRKPPGHTWAIAASSAIFGQNEFAARLVGAVAGGGMVLLAFLFSRRWFGPGAAMAAGLAQLLTPLFWKYQRSAEIEGLHNFLSQAMVLLLIDLLVFQTDHRSRARWAFIVGCGLMAGGTVLAKGPASLPCFLAVVLSACLVGQTRRPLRSGALWSVVSIAAAIITAAGLLIMFKTTATTEPIITQRILGFFWETSFLGVITMIPVAWGQALPSSFLLVYPLWSERRQQTVSLQTQLARVLAATSIFAVLIYATFGLTNPRYAMPAVTFVSLLVGYAVSKRVRTKDKVAIKRPLHRTEAYSFEGSTPWLVRGCALVLVVGWVSYVGYFEPKARAKSGRDEGHRLAALLPDGADIWADTLIEARPETLAYAKAYAAAEGREITIHWKPMPADRHPATPPAGTFVALRTDDEEWKEWRKAALTDQIDWQTEGSVYKYHYLIGQMIGRVPRTAMNEPRP